MVPCVGQGAGNRSQDRGCYFKLRSCLWAHGSSSSFALQAVCYERTNPESGAYRDLASGVATALAGNADLVTRLVAGYARLLLFGSVLCYCAVRLMCCLCLFVCFCALRCALGLVCAHTTHEKALRVT